MCSISPNIMKKLEKTVQAYLEQGRMFTAYDVTIDTRKRENIFLRHDEVGGACHEIESLVDALDFGFQNPQGQTAMWSRTRRDIPGGSGKWVWVYHPTNLDPQSYQFLKSKPQGQQSQPAQPAPTAPSLSISTIADGNTTDSGGEQDDGTFAVDFRNRLMIPTRFMKAAGIAGGDECYVIPDITTNTVLVCKDTPALQAGGIKYTTQKVEKDGELRLSSKTLHAADLKDNKFLIETDDQTLGVLPQPIKVVAVKATT